MLRRLWQWYFWNTPPTCYRYDWRDRLRMWLWVHTHPEWVQEWRHALMVKRALYDAARHRGEQA